jgi:hypothetical protein
MLNCLPNLKRDGEIEEKGKSSRKVYGRLEESSRVVGL